MNIVSEHEASWGSLRGAMSHPSVEMAEVNPYLAARKEWMERYGDYVQAAHHWRLFAIFLVLVCFLAVGGMVYTSTQNHFIPYVVQVDKLGYALSSGRSDQAGAADPRIVRAQLARWVVNVRSIYVDASAERAALDDSYALIAHGSAAFARLNNTFATQSPFERATKESVTVEVHSAIQATPETWRIEWKENTYERTGELRHSEEWQAVVTASISPSDDEQILMRNPIGIYINNIDWTRKL